MAKHLEIKNALVHASVLGFYDPTKPVTIQSDSACSGLGQARSKGGQWG